MRSTSQLPTQAYAATKCSILEVAKMRRKVRAIFALPARMLLLQDFTSIPVDSQAMRKNYRNNPHGTHDPVQADKRCRGPRNDIVANRDGLSRTKVKFKIKLRVSDHDAMNGKTSRQRLRGVPSKNLVGVSAAFPLSDARWRVYLQYLNQPG